MRCICAKPEMQLCITFKKHYLMILMWPLFRYMWKTVQLHLDLEVGITGHDVIHMNYWVNTHALFGCSEIRRAEAGGPPCEVKIKTFHLIP